MEKLRIVEWTTGKVGKMAVRAILDDPRLELVGVYAWSPDKVGQDAGALCGRPDCGVKATNDVEALVALGADTVIYTPFEADLSHLVSLLESGSDVISTNLLTNLGGIVGDVKAQIEAACQRGGSSLYISGINPGWLDTLAAVVTPICRGIESVSVTECVNVSHYESVETWEAVGMSLAEATPELAHSARRFLTSFRDSVQRLADIMRFELDDITFNVEYARTGQDLDLGWFRMNKGSHVALRGSWEGKIKGRTVISNRVIWYMTRDIDQDWDIDDNNYRVDVKGEPDIELRVKVKTPRTWTNLEHAICTALPAVNAIFQIKAAASGILGVAGGGLPAAPAGVWLQAGR
jgi:hypothetical protein